MSNRFQRFFEENAYVAAKRYIYNYHIRRRAVTALLRGEHHRLVLEMGCGVAPVVPNHKGTVYVDLSFTAVQLLKKESGAAGFVVADGTNLPFKSHVFSHTVTSEVLEHIEDDEGALKELARVMSPGGKLVITFPHRKFYFAIDDRYVEHFRRYEIEEIKAKLEKYGLITVGIGKVLGPLEKITMWTVTGVLSFVQILNIERKTGKKQIKPPNAALFKIITPIFKWVNKYYGQLARLDAKIAPMALATVLVIKSQLPD